MGDIEESPLILLVYNPEVLGCCVDIGNFGQSTMDSEFRDADEGLGRIVQLSLRIHRKKQR